MDGDFLLRLQIFLVRSHYGLVGDEELVVGGFNRGGEEVISGRFDSTGLDVLDFPDGWLQTGILETEFLIERDQRRDAFQRKEQVFSLVVGALAFEEQKIEDGEDDLRTEAHPPARQAHGDVFEVNAPVLRVGSNARKARNLLSIRQFHWEIKNSPNTSFDQFRESLLVWFRRATKVFLPKLDDFGKVPNGVVVLREEFLGIDFVQRENARSARILFPRRRHGLCIRTRVEEFRLQRGRRRTATIGGRRFS